MNIKKLSRRKFLSTGIKATTALTALPALSGFNVVRGSSKKLNLVIVGTGHRGSRMWGKFLLEKYQDYINIAALCDRNTKRAAYAKTYIGVTAPTYRADQFDDMIDDIKPDAVIVTTTDCYHAEYIIRAVELGCDEISEKPLVTEAESCRDILLTEKKTGKKVITTFNARHGNTAEEIN